MGQPAPPTWAPGPGSSNKTWKGRNRRFAEGAAKASHTAIGQGLRCALAAWLMARSQAIEHARNRNNKMPNEETTRCLPQISRREFVLGLTREFRSRNSSNRTEGVQGKPLRSGREDKKRAGGVTTENRSDCSGILWPKRSTGGQQLSWSFSKVRVSNRESRWATGSPNGK